MNPSLTTCTTATSRLKTFVSSADHFHPDYTVTFSICHERENGVVTTGSSDWDDYTVSSAITFSQQDGAGLVARAKGHRQYYGAVLAKGWAQIYKQKNQQRIILAKEPCGCRIDEKHRLAFRVKGETLEMYIDGEKALSALDSEYACGQAGFVVDSGAVLGDGFVVERA